MDQDLVTNPKWSQRRQNRATAFRFIFQWEMNQTDDFHRDFKMNLSIGWVKMKVFSVTPHELVDGIMEKIDIIDSMIKELVDNWEF